MVDAAARQALAADPCAVVVLHTVAGSKTGLRLPSPDVAAALRAEFGERVVSVLDACQMRHHPTLIPRWLDTQGPVLMTSSKFFGGPSFGSGVFFPHAAGRIQTAWHVFRCIANPAFVDVNDVP